MKWLIILFLIAAVAVIIAARYRRQIQSGIYLWRMFKKMRQVGKPETKQVESRENTRNVQLVRCARCGAWTPQTNALNLGGKIFYCTTACMENAVKVV